MDLIRVFNMSWLICIHLCVCMDGWADRQAVQLSSDQIEPVSVSKKGQWHTTYWYVVYAWENEEKKVPLSTGRGPWRNWKELSPAFPGRDMMIRLVAIFNLSDLYKTSLIIISHGKNVNLESSQPKTYSAEALDDAWMHACGMISFHSVSYLSFLISSSWLVVYY